MTLRRPRPSGPPPATVPSTVDDEAGFTLIEVLVALMIFTLVSLGVLHSVLSAVQTSGDSRNRVAAANIAAGAVDQARADGRTDLETVVTKTWTVPVEGVTYTVEQSATWVTGTGGASCSASAGSSVLYKRVGVAVTWPTMGTTPAVRTDTVISPPAGLFDPTLSNLAVDVLTRESKALGFAQVRLVGPTNLTRLTDDKGCAFFTGIPAGAYAIEVSKPGHVDTQGSPMGTGSATAVAGATVAYQARLDQAATLQVTGVATPDGAPVDASSYPLPSGSVLSLGHADVQQGRRQLPVQVGVATAPLFPFASGYRTWLGACSDADPEGSSDGATPVRWWPGATVAPLSATAPGASTPVQVRGAQVELRVLSGGSPVVGATLSAHHAAETGTGCAGGESLVLGTTDATGTVRATMPYGKGWSFRQDTTTLVTADLDPAGSYPRVVLP